jgi:hypothetical protein
LEKGREIWHVEYEKPVCNFEDLGVDGRIILKCIFKKWNGSMDWIDLAQNRDRWRALVNAVTNLRVQ